MNNKSNFIKKNVLLLYVFYPLASKLSPFLMKTRVTPTHITVLWLCMMIIAIGLLYAGGPASIILSLFFLAYFFDCLDGQYARDSGLTSSLGKFLDDFGGDVFNVFFWLSLGVIALDSSPMNSSVALSIFLCFSILFRSALILRASNEVRVSNELKSEKALNKSYFPSAKRIILMPLRFGELLWPITLVAYLTNGLFWLILFNTIYNVAVLAITLTKSIRSIKNYEQNNFNK